jgi:hypothetical protein
MRSFVTAAKEHQAEQDGDEFPYEFELDGKLIRFRKPSSGEGTLLTMALARHNSFETKLATALDLFFVVLEPEAKELLTNRLLDLDDPFDGMTLVGSGDEDEPGILRAMIEEWSGDPTQSSSDSSRRSSSTSTASKPSTRKSTSSRSRSTSS